MFNLVAAIICSIIGYVLIIQYSNQCRNMRYKKYFDWNIVLACTDLIIAGMNLSKYFMR